MIRGYVAVVAGDSPSADVLPDSAACKKTAVTLATTEENGYEFYISIKGSDYSFKVIGNVRTVDKRNISSGLLRIGFIVPNLDIVVSGNPKELEGFVYTLIVVKDSRIPVLPPMCSNSTHENELKCRYKGLLLPKEENMFHWNFGVCPVASSLDDLCRFCCFRFLLSYNRDDARKILDTWKSPGTIQISGHPLMKYYKDLRHAMKQWHIAPFVRNCLCDFDLDTAITDPVMILNSITVNSYLYLNEINASESDLFEIPEAFGSLPCLTSLNLSYNRLGQATNWNWLTSPFLRENLCELYLVCNELHSIPENISCLRNLKTLDLNGNCLTELPTALGNLKFLRQLIISENKLVILPGWMYRKECFTNLIVCKNNFEWAEDMFKTIAKPQLQRNEFETDRVQSLFKTVARYIIDNSLVFWEYNIPTTLTDYLEAAYICRCGSVVLPDTTGPVVQCLIREQALAESDDKSKLPIAIRCCSYECYNLIEFFCSCVDMDYHSDPSGSEYEW